MPRPLVVDLDGTYVYGDMLKRDLTHYIGASPRRLVQCISWLIKGRAYLKSRLAMHSKIDYGTLKINEAVLELMVERKRQGAWVILMTGSDQKHAKEVAKISGLFDEVIASSGRINMVGKMKRNLLVRRYGHKGYDYVGNSRQDIAVWKAARVSYATNLGKITNVLARILKIRFNKIDGDVA